MVDVRATVAHIPIATRIDDYWMAGPMTAAAAVGREWDDAKIGLDRDDALCMLIELLDLGNDYGPSERPAHQRHQRFGTVLVAICLMMSSIFSLMLVVMLWRAGLTRFSSPKKRRERGLPPRPAAARESAHSRACRERRSLQPPAAPPQKKFRSAAYPSRSDHDDPALCPPLRPRPDLLASSDRGIPMTKQMTPTQPRRSFSSHSALRIVVLALLFVLMPFPFWNATWFALSPIIESPTPSPMMIPANRRTPRAIRKRASKRRCGVRVGIRGMVNLASPKRFPSTIRVTDAWVIEQR